MIQAERPGVVQLREEKAPGRPWSSLTVPEADSDRELERDILRGHVGIG